jgi:hypothetical protein
LEGGEDVSKSRKIENERMFPHRWMREVSGLKSQDIAVWWYLSQGQA